jgi:hypothetical protein
MSTTVANPSRTPSIDPSDEWLNAIFCPITSDGKAEKQYDDAITAFENLVGYYIEELLKATPKSKLLDPILKCVRFDNVGLVAMLKHFQRDAFGVQKFVEHTEVLVKSGKLDVKIQDDIVKRVHALGLRVTAEEPRKTRIAATFSLWLCVYRPVSFDIAQLPSGIQPESLEQFCACLNYWIASNYLEKFGKVILWELEDADVRLDRIKHDFSCREVSFSTLETLYSSLFRCHPKSAKKPTADIRAVAA